MKLFNLDFRSNDLEFLTKKNKQIIKASDLYAKIKDNTLTDFDPLEEAFKYLSNGDIRRLCRKGGVKRIKGDVYDEARDYISTFLKTIITDTLYYMQYAKRKTVTTNDVIFSIKRHGKSFIGGWD